jgi:hypothetical protein
MSKAAASGSGVRGKEPVRTAMTVGDIEKVHISGHDDGSEVMEEYDVKTGVLLRRKMRRPQTLGGMTEWSYEVGEDPRQTTASFDPTSNTIALAANANPIFLRQDTATHFQFRIRNLPFPIETYLIAVDEKAQELVLSTTNKKYYKRMGISDLQQQQTALDVAQVEMTHQHNTLVISYAK